MTTNIPDEPLAGVQWDLRGQTTYGSYLQLGRILESQQPLSGAHDELLFIVIHQASELWMKLCLHELEGARAQIRQDDLEPAFKMLSRVARVQAQMIQSWEVLATMTPAESANSMSACPLWLRRFIGLASPDPQPLRCVPEP